MGSKTCHHCGSPAPAGASECPVCGFPLRRRRPAAILLPGAAVVALIGGGTAAVVAHAGSDGRPASTSPSGTGGQLNTRPGQGSGPASAGQKAAPASTGPGGTAGTGGPGGRGGTSAGGAAPAASGSGTQSVSGSGSPAGTGSVTMTLNTPKGSSTAAAKSAAMAGMTMTQSPAPGAPAPTGGTSPTTVQPSAASRLQCGTNLALAASPNTGYNYLCRVGSTPVTWGTNTLAIYESGLTLIQQVSFTAAITQFDLVSGFKVTYTTNRAAANVTVTDAPLDTGQPGYMEDGYATVSYTCTTSCVYNHAQVVLSSTSTLTQNDWISTIMHEFGHVAGLNHVSQQGEIMYPVVTVLSPILYGAGDVAGMKALAAERAV